jgi:hypothetical protein
VPVWAPRPRRARNGVPVHPALAWPRTAHTLAWHRAPVSKPPLPCAATHRHAHATPRFAGHVTETTPFLTARGNHRHRRPHAWTQCTTPSRRNCPRRRIVSDEVYLDRAHAFYLYIGDALWKSLSPSFAPPLSPLNQTTSPSPRPEETAVGEQELRGRSSPAKGGGCCHPRRPSALSLWLASLLASPRPHPLLISCRRKQNRRCPSRRRPITGGELVHFQPLHASSAATIVFSDLTSADSCPHLSQLTLVSIRATKP